jgi:ABC-type uncharacterized transport system ATPase subunit
MFFMEIKESKNQFTEDSETPSLSIKLNPGQNVLVGENDSGKTSLVDAIKFRTPDPYTLPLTGNLNDGTEVVDREDLLVRIAPQSVDVVSKGRR